MPQLSKGKAHLHLRPHRLEHTPEDLHAELKHLVHGGDSVPAQAEAEVLLGRLQERSHLEGRIGRDANSRVDKEVGVRAENSEDEVEGQKLGPHGVRAEVTFAEISQLDASSSDGPSLPVRNERLHAELAQRPEHQKGILDEQVLHRDRPTKGVQTSLLVQVDICSRGCWSCSVWLGRVERITIRRWNRD